LGIPEGNYSVQQSKLWGFLQLLSADQKSLFYSYVAHYVAYEKTDEMDSVIFLQLIRGVIENMDIIPDYTGTIIQIMFKAAENKNLAPAKFVSKKERAETSAKFKDFATSLNVVADKA